MNLETLTQILPIAGLVALLFTWWKTTQINQASAGSDRMSKIAKSIEEGAMAFLKAEYRVLLIFVIAVAALLLEWIQ